MNVVAFFYFSLIGVVFFLAVIQFSYAIRSNYFYRTLPVDVRTAKMRRAIAISRACIACAFLLIIFASIRHELTPVVCFLVAITGWVGSVGRFRELVSEARPVSCEHESN